MLCKPFPRAKAFNVRKGMTNETVPIAFIVGQALAPREAFNVLFPNSIVDGVDVRVGDINPLCASLYLWSTVLNSHCVQC